MKPRLLDLFCGAGGAAMGYHRAGFEVVGVDIRPQPNFPFEFHQADARNYSLEGFDVVHASPPCQVNLRGLTAVNRVLGRQSNHADLIAEIRAQLWAQCVPYVIENVVGAKLFDPIRLCGSSFGLPIRRHRLFETNARHFMLGPFCEHDREREAKYWTGFSPKGERTKSRVVQVYGNGGDRHEWGPALGIDWMTPDELTQAIPPAYTEWVGGHIIELLDCWNAA